MWGPAWAAGWGPADDGPPQPQPAAQVQSSAATHQIIGAVHAAVQHAHRTQLIGKFDADGDGLLSFGELAAFYRSLCSGPSY